MENISKKIREPYSHTKSKNYRIENLLIQSLDDCLDDNIFHFRVSDIDQSINVNGSGSDFDKEVALKKALSEFCERAVYKNIGLDESSNGYAAHESLALAQDSSLTELIERDVFLSCWMSKSTPLWLKEKSILEIYPSYTSRADVFGKSGLNIRIGILGVCQNVIVLFGELSPKKQSKFNFGRIIISSASKSFEYGIHKVIIDLRRAVNFILSQETGCSPVFPQNIKKPFEHILYYSNPNCSENLAWLDDFSLNDDIRVFDSILDIQFIEHVNPYKDLIPVTVVQAKSSNSQDYFVGPTTVEKVNMNRIKSFGVKSFSQINKALHPIG